jgi:hypothetical protein
MPRHLEIPLKNPMTSGAFYGRRTLVTGQYRPSTNYVTRRDNPTRSKSVFREEPFGKSDCSRIFSAPDSIKHRLRPPGNEISRPTVLLH